MKYDKDQEAMIANAFEAIGDALMQILSASRQPDWDVRQRASASLGTAAADVYRVLTQAAADHASEA